MKPVRITTCILALLLCVNFAKAQIDLPDDRDYYYVVIGAFAIQKNSENYLKWAEEKNLNARKAWNPNRNLHYVFTLIAVEKSTAVDAVLEMRKLVSDAWVYKGNLYEPNTTIPITMNSTDVERNGGIAQVEQSIAALERHNQNSGNTTGDNQQGNQTGNTTGNTQQGNQTGNTTGNTQQGNQTGNTTTGDTQQGNQTGNTTGNTQQGNQTGNTTGNTQQGNQTGNTTTGNTQQGNQTGNTTTGNTQQGNQTGNTTGNTQQGNQTGNTTGNTQQGNQTGNTTGNTQQGNQTGNTTGNTQQGNQTGNTQQGNQTGNTTGTTQTGNTTGNNTTGNQTGNNSTNPSDSVFIEDDNVGFEDARPKGLAVDQMQEEPEIDEDYKVYVNTTNSQTMREVVGRLDILDIVRNRKMYEVTSHNLVGVNDPRNGTGAIEVVTRFFGYRPKSVQFSITDLESDTTNLVSEYGDSVIVDMPLEPLQHGDLAVLWNVLYFKDAAIMRPESQAELNSLLQFIRKNPNYNIVLHGHTNGSSTGKIIHLNKEDKNYFSMSGDHKTSTGSAKKLSQERAYTIQQWLIEQGVSEERMTIKGWGGKRMLYEETDPRAFLNVRVEVEVLDPTR